MQQVWVSAECTRFAICEYEACSKQCRYCKHYALLARLEFSDSGGTPVATEYIGYESRLSGIIVD